MSDTARDSTQRSRRDTMNHLAEPTSVEQHGASSAVVKRGSARPRRGRAEHEARPRARRVTHDRRDRSDVDAMYLAEMAANDVLAAGEEVTLAENIVRAERELIDALVSAPAGARALARVEEDLSAARTELKHCLLNPDQSGLDHAKAAETLRGALVAARSSDADMRAAVVDTLASLRLSDELVDDVVAAIEAASSYSGPDADALELIEHARADLRRNKERLVVGNLRLVLLFARRYIGRGVPLLDLVQEGNLGLMRAADKFDHTRGFRFSTYAAWWIKQALQRALLDRTLRLPVHVADDRRRVGKVRAAFLARHRREPTADEISSLSGLARERVVNILTLPAQPSSLDTPIGEDGDATLADIIPGSGPAPEATVVHRSLGGHLASLMGALSAREQEVLRMRFGLDGHREQTLEEVGRALSLTRERIRQIEKAALAKLRVRSERVDLESYLEGT